jgi:hypothetical protein
MGLFRPGSRVPRLHDEVVRVGVKLVKIPIRATDPCLWTTLGASFKAAELEEQVGSGIGEYVGIAGSRMR